MNQFLLEVAKAAVWTLVTKLAEGAALNWGNQAANKVVEKLRPPPVVEAPKGKRRVRR